MKKEIVLQNKKISYLFKAHKRSRSISLRVRGGGEVTVVASPYIKEERILNFLRSKAEWLLSKIKDMKKYKTIPIVGSKRAHYLAHKEEARALISERLTHFNTIYNFSYKSIAIKNTKSRWGSCSSKGTLSFSYKLLFLPAELSDYVVVHELCHLKEMNHKRGFWSLVAIAMPEYRERVRELKLYRF